MSKTAYLTIDDGPSVHFLTQLEFLESKNIKAVWFCQGNYMEQRPQMMIEAIRHGHIIGNHSYTHPRHSDLSIDQCFAEFRATDAVIEDLYHQAGITRRYRFFRFPYGDKGDGRRGSITTQRDSVGQARHDAIQEYLRRLGYTQPAFPAVTHEDFRASGVLDDVDWYWTFDTWDWALYFDDPRWHFDTVEEVVARLDEANPSGQRGLHHPTSAEIILMHDQNQLLELFPALINRFLEKGFEFKLPV